MYFQLHAQPVPRLLASDQHIPARIVRF